MFLYVFNYGLLVFFNKVDASSVEISIDKLLVTVTTASLEMFYLIEIIL